MICSNLSCQTNHKRQSKKVNFPPRGQPTPRRSDTIPTRSRRDQKTKRMIDDDVHKPQPESIDRKRIGTRLKLDRQT